MKFFLPLALQEEIFLVQRIVFVISTVLNLISMICLLKQTPPHQSTIKNYLIYIQVLLLLNDLYLDVLFAPIPLFPATAGYCVGILCKWKISIRIQLAILIIFLANIGVAIIVCVMYRHQTILMDSDPFKMSKRTKHLVRTALFVLFNIAPIVLMVPRDDLAKIEQMIDAYPYDISWIRDRGDTCILVERTPLIVIVILTILLILLVATFALAIMFGHMFYALRNSKTDRSFERSQLIRKSLFILLIQLFVPFLLLIVPASTLFFGLLTVDWISFETSLFMYCILPFHSIGHNIILLGITPAYRNFIASFIKRYLLRRENQRGTVQHATTTIIQNSQW